MTISLKLGATHRSGKCHMSVTANDTIKTKQQLLDELVKMRHRTAELEISESERKRVERDLAKRIKELKCLYDIANIVATPNITLDEQYQGVANLLPQT